MGLYVCCWCFTHFCHCAMACCSQLPTLLSPAPQLIRALSLSWSPALIPILRRGRSNCHKTPTALDTKSTHTHTHTDTSCNEKVSSTFFTLEWEIIFGFVVVFFLFFLLFFGIFCRLMRRERRRRKWVIYIFDELSLLNATNQTRLPSFQLPWGQEAMPGKVFAYYKINIIYLCDS